MIQHATYFKQSCTLQQYGSLLGVAPGHYNADIAMEKLIQLGIIKESVSQGFKVYGMVDMMRLHIQCNEDDSIKEQLNELFWVGNAVIKASKAKKGKKKCK